MTVRIEALTGARLVAAIPDLAALRMAVFADWPYLYDGDDAYEREYLRAFVEAPDGILVAAMDGSAIVGAATASPMLAQTAEIRSPFEARGIDTDRLFYFGESVLLPEYRGRGIGHAFFDAREAHAMRCEANAATFAGVIRPDDHPSRPAGYRPLDAFWRKRGYAPIDGMRTRLAWKEHGETSESDKAMQYWFRTLQDRAARTITP